MSSSYALHPEAFQDIDGIWEYIAKDNQDAADRVLGDILAALEMLASSPHAGHHRVDFTLPSFAILARTQLPNCLRPGGAPTLGRRRDPRTAQSACHRCHSPRERIGRLREYLLANSD